MKRYARLWMVLLLIVLLALSLPVQALAAEPALLILGDTYTLSSGERLDESLTILGGSVVIERDALVDGNILLLGGRLRIEGTIRGNISAAGGVLDLADTAVVEGDISTAGASIWQAGGAVIEGKVITDTAESMRNWRANNLHMPIIIEQALSPLAFLFRALVAAALAMLVVMFLPLPVERVAGAIVSQPALSGGMGLLTILVFPLILVVTILTILLIPLGLVGLLVLGLAYVLGWIALGYEVGRRIAAMFHWDWAAPVIAGMGTLVISLLSGGLEQIPCLGWLFSFLVWHVGLGAVILTRFGQQAYGLVLPSGSIKPNA